MVGRHSGLALSVTGAAVAALLAGGCLAGDREPYAEDDEVQPSSGLTPCSQRLRLVGAPRLGEGDRPEEVIEAAFDAERLIGVEENVDLLSGDGGEGSFLRVRYPEESVNFGSADDETPLGGAQFYAPVGAARVLCLHYRVRFEEDFEFAKGGKLPGLYAGEAPSGGDKVSGKDGWSVRLMWRKEGEGELYEYIYNKKGKYGLSVGRGAFTFPRGRWVDIDLETVVNAPGRRDGQARLWIDGQPVIEQHDIVYSTEDEGLQEGGLMFSTFFGGSSDSWASPKDQHIDFADFRFYAGEAD